MTEIVRPLGNLDLFWQRRDERFFVEHLDRRAHIRNAYKGECEGEFWALGPHEPKRRRIVLLRSDVDNKLLKIPVIAFADETIEDRDDILLPMMQEIMLNEAVRQGVTL